MPARPITIEEFGPNTGYVSELLKLYESGSPLVDASWQNYFGGAAKANGSAGGIRREAIFAQLQIFQLISAYRRKGHLAASTNPITAATPRPTLPEDLIFENYQFSSAQLEQNFFTFGLTNQPEATPRQVYDQLRSVYCSTVGFEFEHCTDKRVRDWFYDLAEKQFVKRDWFSKETKVRYLQRLLEAEILDMTCHTRFIGAKRFSVLGGETFVVLLDRLLESGAQLGVEDIVLSMAHRGRINAVVTFAGKPLAELISEFEDKTMMSQVGGGDVKYHLGGSMLHQYDGKKIRLTIPSNPSHLEFVNSVANGMVRAKQDKHYPERRSAALSLSVHGDASFAGQGIVAETFNYSRLRGYETRGTIHLIINNQIGFTTSSSESRSTNYCSDMAKGFNIPVLHVNGDDVEAAAWAADAALRFRQEFQQDIVVDLVCTRKFGHNEGDDPSFTQPLLYKELSTRSPVANTFAQRLVSEQVLSQADADKMRADMSSAMTLAFDQKGEIEKVEYDYSVKEAQETAVDEKRLKQIANCLVPNVDSFQIHPKLKNILGKRVQSLDVEKGIDWGLAEALAMGSLLFDGISIRISGQDSGRGTFSHRHLELHDHEKTFRVYPLAELARSAGLKSTFEVFNSPLSEAAVMGFDFGYAAQSPQSLVCWEAQFGDFANGAQVIIDQFLSSSEQKWNQRSGLVLLLPHGFEGQGPEHSSARLERFLQLCSHNCMTVVNLTSPGQFFHLLRRQALSPTKRPLVVMTPKSMLRLAEAGSSLKDLSTGSFQKVVSWGTAKDKKKPVVLCSGKVIYPIRKALGDKAKIVSIEQLYPWPENEVKEVLNGCSNVFWTQEEPENMGAARYVAPLLQKLGKDVTYFGRPDMAGVATGSPSWHAKEERLFLENLLTALGK